MDVFSSYLKIKGGLWSMIDLVSVFFIKKKKGRVRIRSEFINMFLQYLLIRVVFQESNPDHLHPDPQSW